MGVPCPDVVTWRLIGSSLCPTGKGTFEVYSMIEILTTTKEFRLDLGITHNFTVLSGMLSPHCRSSFAGYGNLTQLQWPVIAPYAFQTKHEDVRTKHLAWKFGCQLSSKSLVWKKQLGKVQKEGKDQRKETIKEEEAEKAEEEVTADYNENDKKF